MNMTYKEKYKELRKEGPGYPLSNDWQPDNFPKSPGVNVTGYMGYSPDMGIPRRGTNILERQAWFTTDDPKTPMLAVIYIIDKE